MGALRFGFALGVVDTGALWVALLPSPLPMEILGWFGFAMLAFASAGFLLAPDPSA